MQWACWMGSCCHTAIPQIASYLNRLTSDLEAAAYPALDALTSRVTSHNLERVRRIKSRLVRLTTRVENVSRRGACGLPVALCGASQAQNTPCHSPCLAIPTLQLVHVG